jgi:hypothetical protein
MPKVELNPALYLRLEALATKTSTVEMMVNRAVDEYLQARVGSQQKGPSVRISPKNRT